MKGYIDGNGNPKIDLQVVGLYETVTVSALIDTGFSGELMLPLPEVTKIGLVLINVTEAQLADGSETDTYVFEGGQVILPETRLPVDILLTTGQESLVGTQLMRRLAIDFERRQVDIALNK